MAKDSQLDAKSVRKKKANGAQTMAESASDNGSNTPTNQSASRHIPGSER
ncbi:MAG: hypothetical protein LIO58_04380 [Oscillospiraceae bacterium]|nr:hypothetical protein [Oscillospiraceae bacterium]